MSKEKDKLKDQNNSLNTEKLKALQATLDKIEKDFGKGTIMKMGDRPVEGMSCISTGSIGLDHALGIGGLPRGRVIEIYGPRIKWKDYSSYSCHCRSSKKRRNCRNYRCGTCF